MMVDRKGISFFTFDVHENRTTGNPDKGKDLTKEDINNHDGQFVGTWTRRSIRKWGEQKLEKNPFCNGNLYICFFGTQKRHDIVMDNIDIYTITIELLIARLHFE